MGTKSFEETSSTAVLRKLRVFRLLLQLLWSRCTRLTQNLFRTVLRFASKYIRIVTYKSWRVLTSKQSLGPWTVAIVASSASLAALYVISSKHSYTNRICHLRTQGSARRTLIAHFKFFWHVCFASVSSTDSRERLDQVYGNFMIYYAPANSTFHTTVLFWASRDLRCNKESSPTWQRENVKTFRCPPSRSSSLSLRTPSHMG